MLKVKLFGIAKDIVGRNSLEITDEVDNVSALLENIKSKYPDFSRLTSILVAVNSEYAELEDKLQENDEIALIPPVSGG